MAQTPTRLPSGLSTQAVGRNLGMYPNPDPTKTVTKFDDFTPYTVDNYTVTAVGTGTVAAAVGLGGRVLLTTSAGATDAETIALIAPPFNFTSLQQVWGYFRLQASDVTNPALVVGLVAALPGTLVITDGIYFRKNAAAVGLWDLVLAKASVYTTLASVATGVVATDVELGFYYNGKNSVDVFVNEIKVASQSVITNLPTGVALTPAAGILNSTTVANSLNLDFSLVAQDRGA